MKLPRPAIHPDAWAGGYYTEAQMKAMYQQALTDAIKRLEEAGFRGLDKVVKGEANET